MALEDEITHLEPFGIADINGEVCAIVVDPTKRLTPKLVGGVFLGGLASMGVHGLVHAEDVPNTDIPNEISVVTVEKGSSPWEAMEAAGYTPAEIAADLSIKQISSDLSRQPIVQPGDLWYVSPEVQHLRAERLGIDLSSMPQEGQLVTLSKPGDTYWQALQDKGLDEHTTEILAANGISEEQAKRAQVGDSIIVPPEYMVEVQTIPVALSEGSSIIEELQKLHVANPDKVARQIMKNMGITKAQSRRMPVGSIIQVPANVIPAPEEPVEQLIETPEAVPFIPAEQEVTAEPIVETVEVFSDNTQPLAEAITEVGQPAQVPQTVFVLGDSISAGMSEYGGLSDVLASGGAQLTVDAEVGRSLHEVANTQDFAALAQYSTVVIELGTNPKESNATFREDLTTVVTQLGQLPEPPHVVLTTVFQEGENGVVPEEVRNQIIQEVASAATTDIFTVSVLDWQTIGNEHPELFEGGDGIHPTDYVAAAQLVGETILSMAPATTVPSEVPPIQEVATPLVEAEVLPVVTTYAEYLSQLQVPEMPEDLRMLQEQAASIGDYNERIAAKAAFMKQYSEWLSQQIQLTPEGYQLFLQSGINKDYIHVFNDEKPIVNDEHIPVGCVVKHWMAGMPSDVESFAGQMKYNVQFAIWGDGTVYQTVPDLDSKAYHAAGVNSRCYGTEMWGEIGTDFTYQEVMSSMYLDIYMSQVFGYPLLRDVAAIEQSPIDKYGDFMPSAEILQNTTFLTHKSVDRVFANDPVGKIDIPEYMANWMYLEMQDFRFQADALWFAYNNPPSEIIPQVPEDIPEEIVEEATQVIPAEETQQTSVNGDVASKEIIDQAWALSPEEYVAVFNNGEHYTVQLRGGEPQTAPADIQQMVDIVWRLENGRSTETVKEALTVALAESGWNNAAKNPNTSDRCWFQINAINRDLATDMNIDYDNLQNDPLGCTRIAFRLFELSEGFKYSASYIDKWESKYGLKLPPDLLELVNSGYISHGWQWWLMSAKRTGVL